MFKHLVTAAVAAVAFLAAQPAFASHIFFGNVQIDGVDLDSATGATNPVFNINVGDSLTFTVDAHGESDGVSVAISGVTGMTPANFYFPFSGGASSFSQVLTFNTVGTFNASAFIDIPSSFPDYADGPCPGCFDTATLPFQVNVSSGVGGVPEPTTWALLIMGFGSAGVMLRRRTAMANA